MADILPAIFFGHGNPMNAVLNNTYTDAWRGLGEHTPRPRAIVSISAHWFVPETGVTIGTAPRTIHDFGGFPRELYQVQYPAPGDPDLARRIQKMLAPLPVALDNSWGLDHGTWSVLTRMFPHADIPVVQLSLDRSQGPAYHYALGKELRALRDKGVLIVGSGNLVHNLGLAFFEDKAYDWALEFDQTAKQLMESGDHQSLVNYKNLGQAAQLAIPTNEHYLPLLYILSLQDQGEQVHFFADKVTAGSLSMRSVLIG